MRERLPGLKVLFTSGYAQGLLSEGEFLRPGTGYIGKPFRRAELARKLREILDATEAVSAGPAISAG